MSDKQILPRPGEIWRYYRGGFYKVLEVAVNVETDELFVVFVSYFQEEDCGTLKWCRPVSGWFDEVEFEGAPVQRYVKIRDW